MQASVCLELRDLDRPRWGLQTKSHQTAGPPSSSLTGDFKRWTNVPPVGVKDPECATLERGELFGEQSLLALSTDKNVKQPKRKTSMVVESEEELICLTATPESLKAVGLQQVRATVHTSHTAPPRGSLGFVA